MVRTDCHFGNKDPINAYCQSLVIKGWIPFGRNQSKVECVFKEDTTKDLMDESMKSNIVAARFFLSS